MLTDIGDNGLHNENLISSAESIFKEKKLWILLYRPDIFCSGADLYSSEQVSIEFDTDIKFVRAGESSPNLQADMRLFAPRVVGNLYTLQEAKRFYDTFNVVNYSDEDLYIYANFLSTTVFENYSTSFFHKSGYDNKPFIYIYGKIENNINRIHIWSNDILFHEMGHFIDSTGEPNYNEATGSSYWSGITLNADNDGFAYHRVFSESVAFFFQLH